jgi:DNA-binding transcriptional ArsR family regulator
MSKNVRFLRTAHDENKKFLRASTHYPSRVRGMPDSEEEIYSTMFSSLKHPARRKILRMLSEGSMTFSQLLEALGITSSHLTYHLENLGELLSKEENGKYRLSTFGAASVETMKIVEEAPAVRSKHGFPLSLRWRSLLAVLVIAVVLLASMSYVQYASFGQLSSDHKELESKYNQLLSWSASTENAITFIQDVIQVDTTEYQATLLSNTVEYRTDFGGVVEEILKYSLANSESQIDVVLRFRNRELSRYQMNLFEGSPIYAQPQPFSVLDAAKGLLQRLSSFKDASYLEDMGTLLVKVGATENTEITEGNMKLKVSISGANAEVQWLYTENGVDFPAKSLTLNFEDYILKELTDGWFLFSIGSTEVNVSSEEAIEIARNAVKSYTWNADGTTVSDFKVLDDPFSIVFHPTIRGENLALIPHWYLILYLDKVYPGGFNRIAVGVWADTGDIALIRPLSG